MTAHLYDHDNNPSHPCDFCDKVFVNVYAWHRHGFKVHGKRLKCEECNKKYQYIDRFIWHLRYKHTEKSYACSQCTYSTTMRARLKRHVERRHLKQCIVYCDVCSKGFLDKLYLQEHKHIHSGDAPNQCERCGKSFRMRSTLRAHKFKFHAEHYPNVCHVCNKAFATKSGLESHCLAHEVNKQHICEFCNKRLTTAATLREHRRIHTGELPFTCGVCEKGFRAKKHLTRHVARHDISGESKTHKCYFCKKQFFNARACVTHSNSCRFNSLEDASTKIC